MIKNIDRMEILEIIMNGLKKSIISYRKLCGGYSLIDIPESFIQSNIALEFSKKVKNDNLFFVTTETSLTKIRKERKFVIDDNIDFSDRQRFDILLWHGKNDPVAIIELKTAFSHNSCDNDANRIKNFINSKKNKIEFGYIVAYTYSYGKNFDKVIKNRFDKINKNVKAKNYKILYDFPLETERGHINFAVFCF